MYDRILLPVEAGEEATPAREHAIDLAERYGATLYILHVADTARASITGLGDEVLEDLEREGENTVAEIARAAADREVRVVDSVVQGTPYETIGAYADEQDIDLIVMATRARTGLSRHLLGSTTERVVRTVPVPVLTVHGKE